MGGRIVFKRMLGIRNGVEWTGIYWLRIDYSGRFHEMFGNF
jgi:hypothetical protein